MSDFNFDGADPETGPVTPVLVFPVELIGPFVPVFSSACAIEVVRRAEQSRKIAAESACCREEVFLARM
jgi:hypothetical protein